MDNYLSRGRRLVELCASQTENTENMSFMETEVSIFF